ncbi:MarR family winged helix-turn-helix transcriptional regulator [Marmoricola sp. URHA0025 HA25]
MHEADRELQTDMVRAARTRGWKEAKFAHNAVFGTLGLEGAHTAELAVRAGVTRQSMGEIVRELVGFGILEMTPDPTDRRAKRVTYSELGLEEVTHGWDHIVDLEERIVAELGEDGYEQLRTGLQKVVEVLRSGAGED